MLISVILCTPSGELDRQEIDTRNFKVRDPNDSEAISDVIKDRISRWTLGPGHAIRIEAQGQ
jgi:hypothetical protein